MTTPQKKVAKKVTKKVTKKVAKKVVKKKAVGKKRAVRKKSAASKKTTASKQQVIHHDPFAELEADQGMADSASSEAAVDVEPLPSAPADPEDELQSHIAEESDMSGPTEDVQQNNGEQGWTDVQLGHGLTITDAESRKIELNHLLADALPVRFHAEDIDQVDGAGMQLLTAFFVQAKQQGQQIGWSEVSPVLLDAARLLGLADLMELPGEADADADANDGEGTAWGLF